MANLKLTGQLGAVSNCLMVVNFLGQRFSVDRQPYLGLAWLRPLISEEPGKETQTHHLCLSFQTMLPV